jgi:tetraacyldisaccharide 4'-kinase
MLRRILLFPFALLWGLVLWVRHSLCDAGVLKSVRPTVPTIVIGNLSFGGTGKTPHVRLVVETLRGEGAIATLSRGYGGRVGQAGEVKEESAVSDVGDEPLMLKRALPWLRVFVGADRVKAIEEIQRMIPDVKAVVLDDAFQHRRLNAGLNVLLTTWGRPFSDDVLVPAGNLRDLRSRAKAAQVVVVTKCPREAGGNDGMTAEWRRKLDLRAEQRLFFSGLEYGVPRPMNGSGEVPMGAGSSALLVTGIADPTPLVEHAREVWGRVEHVAFPDHHAFTPADLERLAGTYATFAGLPKSIVTTEKDAVRLLPLIKCSALEQVPIAVVPVKAVILNHPNDFSDLLRRHLAPHPAHG